jgi:hypothetical protein
MSHVSKSGVKLNLKLLNIKSLNQYYHEKQNRSWKLENEPHF